MQVCILSYAEEATCDRLVHRHSGPIQLSRVVQHKLVPSMIMEPGGRAVPGQPPGDARTRNGPGLKESPHDCHEVFPSSRTTMQHDRNQPSQSRAACQHSSSTLIQHLLTKGVRP
eukprot:4196195-Amphidinium_carterae.1